MTLDVFVSDIEAFDLSRANKALLQKFIWAIGSPDWLNNDILFSEQNWLTPIKKQVKQSPQKVLELLKETINSSNRYRLGEQFEHYWKVAFLLHPHFDLIEFNLQVIINQKTIGEFDFIVFDKVRNKFIHVEVALKFYLWATSPMNQWIGPNANDRWHLKQHKLLNHQLKLSKQQEVALWLESKSLVIEQSVGLVKGRVFVPNGSALSLDFSNDVSMNIDGLNQSNQVHFYFTLKDFLAHLEKNQNESGFIKWQWLDKSDWCLPNEYRIELDTAMSIECLLKLLQSKGLISDCTLSVKKSLMIASYTSIKHHETLSCNQRYFIVPEFWPHLH